MNRIEPNDVATKYNNQEKIWDPTDSWHSHTKKEIDRFVWAFLNGLKPDINFQILNAGSGGATYSHFEPFILHVDIAKEKIKHLPNAMVADLHNIPLQESSFQAILCVGSVVNYCDVIRIFQEFYRLLQTNGFVVLEFENSKTLELIGTRDYNKKAVLRKTFYQGQEENLWYYSEDYIRELARIFHFKILKVKRIHLIAPLIYRLIKSEKKAALFGKWDAFVSKIPFLKRHSSNTILLLQKTVQC